MIQESLTIYPVNDDLRITYLLGKIHQETLISSSELPVIGCVPINRYGQRTLIRCCPVCELPHGIKFVSGTYLDNGSYSMMAGGLIAFRRDPMDIFARDFRNVYAFGTLSLCASLE